MSESVLINRSDLEAIIMSKVNDAINHITTSVIASLEKVILNLHTENCNLSKEIANLANIVSKSSESSNPKTDGNFGNVNISNVKNKHPNVEIQTGKNVASKGVKTSQKSSSDYTDYASVTQNIATKNNIPTSAKHINNHTENYDGFTSAKHINNHTENYDGFTLVVNKKRNRNNRVNTIIGSAVNSSLKAAEKLEEIIE
ncbi:hypothetical protein QE152_g38325 [Popillia japonica]|uniref:Uncharacterized protein n=1 Tax=Popillia japonica TaxID=7064 RepID=A0AAW1I7I5_POPJA